MSPYSREDFIKFWNDGYNESFVPYKPWNENKASIYQKIVIPFINPDHICLEIGPGGGTWSNSLVNDFKKLIAIDVMPRSRGLNNKIDFFQLESFDYFCTNIEDNSIDFVFSFGTFCHLPVSAQTQYIKNILRVLKEGGNAVIMFGDWDTHFKDMEKIPEAFNNIDKENYKENVHCGGWFYMNKEIIKEIMNINNILEYTDLMPGFRDRVIHFKK